MEERINFLAIGDIVNDDFIDLQDVKIEKESDGISYLEMRFGDKIPYKGREFIKAVGNSPNAAVSATRLGLHTGLMSHVGDDDLGEQTLDTLRERGVRTDWMTTEENKETNYHFVLRYQAERTILIKHETYTYDLAKQVAGKPLPEWVYFSSVGEDSIPYHHDIATWVRDNNINLSFQPGTFQIKLGHEPFKDLYAVCAIFFCNVEEAQKILTPILGEDSLNSMRTQRDRKQFVKFLLEEIRNLGPMIACITDGPDGAYAQDGDSTWFMPIYPDPGPPVDRTGAGDSFSSTFTSAVALGNSIDVALKWGPINSMSVVQHVGAQAGLLSREKLFQYLEDAPEWYRPEKI